MTTQPILVTGATGAQGGAVARALLAAGCPVRFLTRRPGSRPAQTLVEAGAEACEGDLGAPDSVAAAVDGAAGVFSVQVPGPNEVAHGTTLIEAASRAGVRHFVHTSVTETKRHTTFPDWGTGRWLESYWTAKWALEVRVREAGFSCWTVLRPAFLMDNFIPPKVAWMFPQLRTGELLTAMNPQTVLQMISADDIGAFAAAAFRDPDRFHAHDIDLAAEAPTIEQIAETLSAGFGRSIRLRCVTPDAAREAGLFAGWVQSQEWTNAVGYRADIAALARYPVPLTSFAQWIARMRDRPGATPGADGLA